jgi:hypothetical protein
MGAQVRMTTIGERSARMRLGVARTVLALGWAALAVSLPLVMDYEPASVWNPQQLVPSTTWAFIWWFVSAPYLQGVLLVSPYLIGLTAGTLATALPSRFVSSRLIWVCRIGTVGVCESWTLGALKVAASLSNVDTSGSIGSGFLFCGIGSLLIGLSVWIRPVRAGSGGKNGEQNTASGANPDSGTEGT